jgi:hypothetical protein
MNEATTHRREFLLSSVAAGSTLALIGMAAGDDKSPGPSDKRNLQRGALALSISADQARYKIGEIPKVRVTFAWIGKGGCDLAHLADDTKGILANAELSFFV